MRRGDDLYRSPAWKALRLRILARDGHECQMQHPGCLGYATTVDHIVPRVVDPDLAMVPDNLRAACTSCNERSGGRLGALRKLQRSPARISAGFDAW